MRFRFSSLVVLAAGMAFAQKASFDVASIKPAEPQPPGVIMMRAGGDPGMIDYKHVSLRFLVQRAFNVKDYQIVGPDWMGTAFFDVQAKLPPDTSQEKRAEMMQTLLEERFGMKFHKETKDVPIYALVVGKNGSKLKEATELPPNVNPDGTPKAFTPPAGGPDGGGAAGGVYRRPIGGPPPGGRAAPGNINMQFSGNRARLEAKAIRMSGIVDMLARQVDRPVIDNTGLTGFYDIDLEFKPDMSSMMRGMPVMPRGDGPGPGPGPGAGGPAPDAVEAPSIFTAVQDQLGLKLDGKKGPVETIVVDRMEKSPIEN